MAEQDGTSTEGVSARVGRGPSRRRWPVMVALGLGVLAAGWTAAWAVARGRVTEEIDRQIAALTQAGIVVGCQERGLGGFPFRFEFVCHKIGLTMPGRGVTVTAEELRVVAQVWDPFLVIAEIDGPFTADDGHSALDGTWARLAVSLRWTGHGAERVSLAADDVKLATRAGVGMPGLRLVAAHLEGHGRPSGTEGNDLDLALSTAAAGLEFNGKRVGPERSDFSASATLVGFLPPGPGEPLRVFASRGGRIEPIRLTLASGGLSFSGKGALTVLPDGLLDGSIGVAAQGLESLAGGGARVLGSEATTLATGFILLGKPSTDADLPGRRLDLVIDHGRPRLGRVQFGAIAPLF